jgi:hypothetical protein
VADTNRTIEFKAIGTFRSFLRQTVAMISLWATPPDPAPYFPPYNRPKSG